MRELGMFSLEKRNQEEDMIALFKYLKGCHVEEGTNFSPPSEYRTRSNGCKLQDWIPDGYQEEFFYGKGRRVGIG